MISPDALGAMFAASGAVILFVALTLLPSTPLVALGVAVLLPGLVLLNTPFTPIPKRSTLMLMESSALSIEALLEEFKASEQAMYVACEDGLTVAFIPFERPVSYKAAAEYLSKAPFRTIVRRAGVHGLCVLPPAAQMARILGIARGASLEAAVFSALVDMLEVAEDVKVSMEENRVVVSFRSRVVLDLPRYNRCLGSFPASVAGCIIPHVVGGYARLLRETLKNGRHYVVFEVG